MSSLLDGSAALSRRGKYRTAAKIYFERCLRAVLLCTISNSVFYVFGLRSFAAIYKFYLLLSSNFLDSPF